MEQPCQHGQNARRRETLFAAAPAGVDSCFSFAEVPRGPGVGIDVKSRELEPRDREGRVGQGVVNASETDGKPGAAGLGRPIEGGEIAAGSGSIRQASEGLDGTRGHAAGQERCAFSDAVHLSMQSDGH